MHRDERRSRQPVPQLRIDADGGRRRVGHEQHDRLDQTPPRLRHEADFIQDAEELLERRVAEVDDLGAGIVRDQAVEQLHLAERFSYVDRPDQMREASRERRLARIEVVADERAVAGVKKFDQQSRQQRLAHARPRRGDDVKWMMRLRHGGDRSPCRRSQPTPRRAPARSAPRSRPADDLHARPARLLRLLRRRGGDDVVELDAVVLAPDVAEPVPDVTAQHKGIVRRLALRAFVGDEGEERNRGELHLFERHLVELGDSDRDRILLLEIG